ncbi:TonB-dependent receptor [Sphingobium sp. C100]|uniref:TonB-dependent receptor n=1 Tax=Sphingobium sp. C100 TaxID=1207055 RepID=UPI0013782FBE|nr:TonB-dependent receptor [Sphingobium sp. C100]
MMRAIKANLVRISMLSASVTALAVATPVMAQAQVREFNIPAQPLSSALLEFSKQSDVLIVVSPEIAQGKRSPAVRGSLPVNEAIGRLLRGSGLRAIPNPRGGYRIERTMAAASSSTQTASSAEGDDGSRAVSETIIVTGTRLTKANDTIPLQTYTREAVEAATSSSVADFLNTLPAASLNVSADRTTSFGGATTVQLRGFPAGTTTTLLNGRRLAPSGDTRAGSTDLDSLPLSLIEQIDIQPSGASAVYGSDGIAGVVNFITRRVANGGSAAITYQTAEEINDIRASVSYGGKTGDLQYIAGISYEHNEPLYGRDRKHVSSGDFSRFSSLGGRDARNVFCLPGNVRSVNGSNLPGLGSSFAAVPALGNPTVQDFQATAGTRNMCGREAELLRPETERLGFYGALTWHINDRLEVFADVIATRLETDQTTVGKAYRATMSAGNPYNPFGVDVIVESQLPVRASIANRRHFYRPTVGLRGALSERSSFEIAAYAAIDNSTIRDYSSGLTADVNRLNSAISSTSTATALNPFDPASQKSISEAIYVPVDNIYENRLYVIDGRVTSDIVDLPAGPIEIVLGGELSFESAEFKLPQGTSFVTLDADRNVQSAFTEVRAPLLAGRGRRELLAVYAAGRVDRYSDVGTSVTSSLGAVFKPHPGIEVRGSYSEAFRAPPLRVIYTDRFVGQARVVDPTLPGMPQVLVPTVGGGSSELDPEVGDTFNIGIELNDRLLPGLRVSVDHWWLHQGKRVITTLPAQVVVDNADLFPGRAVRDGAGNLTSINISATNYGELDARGFDFRASYEIGFSGFTLIPSVNWTLIHHFEAAVTPGAPLENRLNAATRSDAWAPRHKGTVSLALRNEIISANLQARYVGRYLDYQTPANTNMIGDFITLDAFAKIKVSGLIGENSRDAFITLGARNMLNKGPQYSNYANGAIGFDPTQYDIVGRKIQVGLTTSF